MKLIAIDKITGLRRNVNFLSLRAGYPSQIVAVYCEGLESDKVRFPTGTVVYDDLEQLGASDVPFTLEIMADRQDNE